MRKIYPFTPFIFILFLCSFLFDYDKKSDLREVIPVQIEENHQHLKEAVEKLKQQVHSNGSQEEVRSTYLQVRKYYKKLEVYFTYYENDLVRKRLNGTPLPYLEENTADGAIIQPQGLQVIDEAFGIDFQFAQKKNG